MDKEEYDRLKLEKEEGKRTGKRIKRMRSILLWIVPVAMLLGGGALLFPKLKPEPLGPDFSTELQSEGASHIAEGTEVEYQTNPPASGNHWPVPLRDGVYAKEKPDEAVVHSLEHGRVWISYKPTIPESAKKQLEKLGQQGVIVSPRSANDTDIALAAWTRIDKFNLKGDGSLDLKRIKDFISRYKNKGPEFVPGMGGGKSYE